MQPDLSIVVASHHRPLRLRWLLNALQEQTLERSVWEVIVAYDPVDHETATLLRSHPLAGTTTLRAVSPAPATPGARRNAAIREAQGNTLVFTDDDCRPPADWLQNVASAVRRNPGAIIQGPVQGDPDDEPMLRAPYPRTTRIDRVPTPWAECSNIVYPRELVQRIGGFDEEVGCCEDADLGVRARAAGGRYVGDHSMPTYHAVDEESVLDWVRASGHWRDVPWLLGRHPRLRAELLLGVFWRREHLWLLVVLWWLWRAQRNPALLRHPHRLLLLWRWAGKRGAHGSHLRGRLRDLLELPGWALIDAAELVALIRGSARHRTLVL